MVLLVLVATKNQCVKRIHYTSAANLFYPIKPSLTGHTAKHSSFV